MNNRCILTVLLSFIIFKQVTTAGKVAVVLALVITVFVLVAGTFVETMRFEFKGLVGLILKDEADVDYSFVTVGTSIPEHRYIIDFIRVLFFCLTLSVFCCNLGTPRCHRFAMHCFNLCCFNILQQWCTK